MKSKQEHIALKRLRIVLRAGLVTLLTVGVLSYVWIGGFREEPQVSDAIVVLGAAVWPGGQPSPALYARTTRAVDLYKRGYASHLVLTGGLGKNPPSEAEVMRRIAVGQGVPPEAIVVEDQAHSTWDSATLVASICRDHGWSRVLVVSDPFHLARSRLVFRDQGLTVSTGATRDSYYSAPTRSLYVLREVTALYAYLLGKPFV